MRLQQTNQLSKNNTHSAFATGSNPKGASFRGQSTSTKPPCICGDSHWYSDCHYRVPEKRPTGWTANPTKQKKVNEALQNAEKKTSVDKALQRSKDQASTKSVTSTQQSTPSSGGATTGGTVATTSTNANLGSFSAFSSSSYPLKDSWILDNGLDTHVCNSSMRSQFIQTRLSEPHDNLTAGTQTIPIESFGTVDITIQTPTG